MVTGGSEMPRHTHTPQASLVITTCLQHRLASRISPTGRAPPAKIGARDCRNYAKKLLLNFPFSPLQPDNTDRHEDQVCTDGSGSKGRATTCTPQAGWGIQQGQSEITGQGRVNADHSSPHYFGAQVGSNNTGELAALIATT